MFNDEQNIWNILFSVLFLAAAFFAYAWLVAERGVPTYIPVWDAVLLALATFRLTRLFVYDHITQFVRDLFLDVHTGESGTLVREKPATGPRRTVAALLGCPWCFGVWAAFVVAYFYYLTPYAWFFLFALALAGVGTLIQILANLIGWSAEFKKRTVEGPGANGQHSGTCG